MERNATTTESKMEIKWNLSNGAEAIVTVSLVSKSDNLKSPVVGFVATVGGAVVGEGCPQRQRAGAPVFAAIGRLGMSEAIYNQIIAAENTVMASDVEWVARRAAHDSEMAQYDANNAATRKAMSY
jgi:hypothetical protein